MSLISKINDFGWQAEPPAPHLNEVSCRFVILDKFRIKEIPLCEMAALRSKYKVWEQRVAYIGAEVNRMKDLFVYFIKKRKS